MILPAYGNTAQRAFGGIIVERQAAVVEATHQRGPSSPHLTESRSELGFARELAHGCVGPRGQCFDNRLLLELVPQLSAGTPKNAMSLRHYLLFNATSS